MRRCHESSATCSGARACRTGSNARSAAPSRGQVADVIEMGTKEHVGILELRIAAFDHADGEPSKTIRTVIENAFTPGDLHSFADITRQQDRGTDVHRKQFLQLTLEWPARGFPGR